MSHAKRVTAMLDAKAREPLEQMVKTLTMLKAGPKLSAVVMEHMGRLALEMAAEFRAQDGHREKRGE